MHVEELIDTRTLKKCCALVVRTEISKCLCMYVTLAYSCTHTHTHRIFSMPQLQLLKAFNNRLISLPQAVDRACILEHLDLHGNQLSSLPPQLLIRTNRYTYICFYVWFTSSSTNMTDKEISALPEIVP